MTTDSGVAPNPGDPQQQPDPNAPAEQQGQEAQTVVDADEQELAAAKAEAEAEKASTESGDETEAAAPGGEQQPKQPVQAAQPETIHVPKARLDEVLAQRDRSSQEAAYWKGVADARVAQPAQQGTSGQQQQPQQTAEQRLTAIHAEQDALAKKFDDGEITFSDLKKHERELNNREQGIREELLLSKVPKPQPAKQNDDLYLDAETARLEQEHPWVVVADKVGTAIDWKYFEDRAAGELVQQGIDPHDGARGKLALRAKVAEIIDNLGPSMLAGKAKAQGIPIPGEAAGAQQRQPMSPAAKARQDKLNLAANAPPNVAQMNGTTGDNVAGVPSEGRLEAMSDDEIGALPDSMRRKLLGLTA